MYMTSHNSKDMTDEGPTEIEIEQKFVWKGEGSSDPLALTKKLVSLGFQKTQDTHGNFIDWYFDTPAPHWTLTC